MVTGSVVSRRKLVSRVTGPGTRTGFGREPISGGRAGFEEELEKGTCSSGKYSSNHGENDPFLILGSEKLINRLYI